MDFASDSMLDCVTIWVCEDVITHQAAATFAQSEMWMRSLVCPSHTFRITVVYLLFDTKLTDFYRIGTPRLNHELSCRLATDEHWLQTAECYCMFLAGPA